MLGKGFRLLIALFLAAGIALALPEQPTVDGWSLFPPIVAILVALSTGQLILGLCIAIVAGAALSLPPTPVYLLPIATLQHALVDFFWEPLVHSFQFYILGFTAALIGMVRVISLAGGTQGIAQLLASRAAGARSARTATVLMGLAIFFDDYANTIVVGTTMQPIGDRFRISREKIAYLVDSTAAPVAGLAVISTWIAYEVGLFEDIMQQLGTGISGYELFFRALPVRFYCILTLGFVLLSTMLRRDFGPMLRAERRAALTGHTIAPDDQAASGGRFEKGVEVARGIRPHWATAAVPIGVVVFGVLLGMNLDSWSHEAVVASRLRHSTFSFAYWAQVLAHADSAKIMFLASLAGSALVFAIALSRREPSTNSRVLGPGLVLRTWVQAITGFRQALIILVLAWSIKETCVAVGTSDYLIASLSGLLSPAILPVLVFLLAAIVAFSIGTSWTTMAILLPTMLPVAADMGGAPLIVLVAAAVLDGAIFGDHCSPISDTTVLSSIASSCDHIAHVRTQIPYALTTMTAAALFGYLGTTLWYPGSVGLILGLGALTLVLLVAGSNPEQEALED